MEDRSKRAQTVRPQLGERCEKRRVCDTVLSATNDENGDELNGETDDEDIEDGEVGFDDGSAQVRNIRDPGQPTAKDAKRAAKFIDQLGHNRVTLRCETSRQLKHWRERLHKPAKKGVRLFQRDRQ